MNIELKNLKINTRLSEETNCFSATIYVDGKRVGEVVNRGQGGPNEYRLGSDMQLRLEDHARQTFDIDTYNRETRAKHSTLALVTRDDPHFEWLDQMIHDLVVRHETDRQYRKWCRTAFVFSLRTSKPGEYFTLKPRAGKATPAFLKQARAFAEQKYGSQLAEVLNDRFPLA
jgi:hypothetical protein